MYHGDVTVLYSKLFFEALVARDATSVRDTAARARSIIVDTVAHAPHTSQQREPLRQDGEPTAQRVVGTTPLSGNATTTGSSSLSDAHRGLLVTTMLQYLCAVKSGGDATGSKEEEEDSHPHNRSQRHSGNQRFLEDDLYRKEVERTARDSETQVIHVLISFIVSSPSSTFTEEVRAAFLDHFEFLLFCAVAQCRSLVSYGAAMRLPPVAALGGVVKAPSVVGGGPADNFNRSATSGEQYPLPPQNMDYYWLAYFVLLLLGADGVKQRLQKLLEPLTSGNGVNHVVEDCDRTAFDEGLSAVGNMITELCLTFSQVLTREVRQPTLVLADQGLHPTPGRSPAITTEGAGGVGGGTANKEAFVGDILHYVHKEEHCQLAVFPPPCIRQILGWEPLSPLPSKKVLVVPPETLHVLARFSDIMTLVVEEMATQSLKHELDLRTSPRHKNNCSNVSMDAKQWGSTLLAWVVRLSSFCFLSTLGGSRVDGSNGAALRQMIVTTCHAADLYSKITSADMTSEAHEKYRRGGGNDGQLVMMYVIAIQLCALCEATASSMAAAAESAHRLIACVARCVVSNHKGGSSPSINITAGNRASARMTSVTLAAIANVLQLADGVETVVVAAARPHDRTTASSAETSTSHAATSHSVVNRGVRTFVGLVESITDEVRQAHLDAEHALVLATRSDRVDDAAGDHSSSSTAAAATRAELHAAAMAGLQGSLSVLRMWLGESSISTGPPDHLFATTTSSETSWRLAMSALELSALQLHRAHHDHSNNGGDVVKEEVYRGGGLSSSMGSSDELSELMVSLAANTIRTLRKADFIWADADSFRKLRKTLTQTVDVIGNEDADGFDDPAPQPQARSPRAAAASAAAFNRPRSGSSGSGTIYGGAPTLGGGPSTSTRQRFDYASAQANAPCAIVFGRSLLDVSLWFFSRALAKTAKTATATRASSLQRTSPQQQQQQPTTTLLTLILMAESFAQLLLVTPDAVGRNYAYKLLDDVCALKRMRIAQDIVGLHAVRDELLLQPRSQSAASAERVSGLEGSVSESILDLLAQQNALYSLKACTL
jgi:hypothetical protein